MLDKLASIVYESRHTICIFSLVEHLSCLGVDFLSCLCVGCLFCLCVEFYSRKERDQTFCSPFFSNCTLVASCTFDLFTASSNVKLGMERRCFLSSMLSTPITRRSRSNSLSRSPNAQFLASDLSLDTNSEIVSSSFCDALLNT